MPEWPVLSRYDSDHLREIAMPIGGIGTGFFALGGRGQLTDWQLMSRPNRGWKPMYSHLILRTHQPGADPEVKVRVLEGDLTEGLASDFGAPAVLAGLPRFHRASFEASYPFGRVNLTDEHTPVAVRLEAFNPLIPGDTDNSSLPLALLTVTITNTSGADLDASLTLLLSNFVGTDGLVSDLKDNVTERLEVEGWKGMLFSKAREVRSPQAGTLAVLCDAPDVRVARRWPFRDRPWNGESLGILDSLVADGFLPDDEPDKPCPPSPQDTWDSSLSALVSVPKGTGRTVRLLLTWRFPYRDLKAEGWWSGPEGADPVAENHYATRFKDAADVARKVIPALEDLRDRTVAFVSDVVKRKAPQPLKEAALFNLTALRSHTCFRLADGTFLAFEGCGGNGGCCTGSCTHVWNYEEATVRLFPDLHRSMLESHLSHALTPSGAERFRVSLPMANQTWAGAAADGQMGMVVRVYEQYLADKGRDGLEWLKRWYPAAKSMLEFAWVPGGWDANQDGVMEGCQHNTYDVEFFGPNPQCGVWYLAALAAGAEMARLVGDAAFEATCDKLRKQGAEWLDGNLYNGRFYTQHVQPATGEVAAMTSLGEEWKSKDPRFQIGAGCLVDQLVGQYKANRVGLGDLLDSLHLRTTARSIFRNNYKEHFRDHYNNMRTFAQGSESGTLICSYPDGDRPKVPFPYWGECMTGFEYQLAVLLLDYGFRDEGLAVAKAVRDRHSGANRNPFNEPECGSYYARCMASWALLDAWDEGERRG
ncbi:MAG TPA: GH116 family glycosyl-hydrolase [Armatimonadota bacterium]|jgi:uncharacterized protein (DUF608 family)